MMLNMMLSEDEAGVRWCPQLLAVYIPADKHREYLNKQCKCHGSACMAWRWEDRKYERGYCGLAGKPVVP